MAPILLAAAACAVYANAFQGAFVHDDHFIVLENPHIRKLWPPWEAIYGYPNARSPDRPVGAYSLALSYALSGERTWGFHLVNLLIHALAGLALYGLVRRVLLLEPLRERYGATAGGLAFAVALVWLVHPVGAVCVTYIIQRVQALMSLFFLLTLYAAMRAFTSAAPKRWYAAGILACLLGMGCKQDMAGAPLAVLLLDALFISAGPREALRRRAGFYLGLAACWIPLAVLVLRGRMQGVVELVADAQWTRSQYALSQFQSVLTYLRLAVWPLPTSFQHYPPVSDTAARFVPPMLAVLALLGAVAWGLWKRRPWAFPGALFFPAAGAHDEPRPAARAPRRAPHVPGARGAAAAGGAARAHAAAALGGRRRGAAQVRRGAGRGPGGRLGRRAGEPDARAERALRGRPDALGGRDCQSTPASPSRIIISAITSIA
ncbi:MAG: glycosyltransferase family 39 protein [Planctomycetota bacterium]|nr:glycosyltransferase family 39 protein [Planctomycetota bacterium]